MATTYIDNEGDERCDDCELLVEDCTCTCVACGDAYQECVCGEEE